VQTNWIRGIISGQAHRISAVVSDILVFGFLPTLVCQGSSLARLAMKHRQHVRSTEIL
jgi:hypothetical protein